MVEGAGGAVGGAGGGSGAGGAAGAAGGSGAAGAARLAAARSRPARSAGLTNEALFSRARAVTPGGVNSPVRAFRSVGGNPYFVARGDGPWVWDVEGRRYLDLVQSYGASIHG
ncbi:MAG TPA: hypothetical protein VKV25_01360, partial [Acidimicrobiales bacterium]|nr:hypothetical protein [Acidimicrobiales bacterium]